MMAACGELWKFLSVGNILLFLLFVLLFYYLMEFYQFRGMPPGPRLYTIPFFGNFLSFDSNGPGKTLRENTQSLMKQYGKVLSLRLGSYKVVIAASGQSLKEILVEKSADYAGRPPFHSWQIVSFGGKNVVFANDRPTYKLKRRLMMSALRHYLHDTQKMGERLVVQAERVLQFMKEQEGKPFDPSDILDSCIAQISASTAFGNRVESSHIDFYRLTTGIQKYFSDIEQNESAEFFDFFPLTKYFPIQAYEQMKKQNDAFYEIVAKYYKNIEETFDPNEPATDFISEFLKARWEAEVNNKLEKMSLLTEDHGLASLLDIFAAFLDIAESVRWAIIYMLHFPEYQFKIQQELDDRVGRHRFPSLDDSSSLPLLQAVIMEIQRLSNTAVVAIPHYTTTDTSLCGYRVPKGTIVLANLEEAHLDPECWENPQDFNPYRFIDAEGRLIKNPSDWFVYSGGERNCAGMSIAKAALFLFLSIMLQHYTFVPEEGTNPQSRDSRVFKFSFTVPTPFTVCAIERE